MIIEMVSIVAPEDKSEGLCSAILSLIGPTQAAVGCLSCNLFRDVSDLDVLHVESRWETQNDLVRHLRSDAYKRLILLMELGAAPPSIAFYTVTEVRGLDLIEAARQPAV